MRINPKKDVRRCSFCNEPVAITITNNGRTWCYCKFHDAELQEKFPEFYKKIVMPSH